MSGITKITLNTWLRQLAKKLFDFGPKATGVIVIVSANASFWVQLELSSLMPCKMVSTSGQPCRTHGFRQSWCLGNPLPEYLPDAQEVYRVNGRNLDVGGADQDIKLLVLDLVEIEVTATALLDPCVSDVMIFRPLGPSRQTPGGRDSPQRRH